jgi:hypothetical protein
MMMQSSDSIFFRLVVLFSIAAVSSAAASGDQGDKSFVLDAMGHVDSDVPDVQSTRLMRTEASEAEVSKHAAFSEIRSSQTFDGPCNDYIGTTNITLFGSNANCTQLAPYCGHVRMGVQIQKLCPVSCYQCIPGVSDGNDAQQTGDASTEIGHVKGGSNASAECDDNDHTYVKFSSGTQAECADLVGYCDRQDTLGVHVKQACQKSCGLCDAFVVPTDQWHAHSCWDSAALAPPQFKIHGSMANCSDLTNYCHNNPHADTVRRKCPRTCGICTGADDNEIFGADWQESDEGSGDGDDDDDEEPSSTTYLWTWPDETHPKSKGVMGCSRRRRWGFCYERRRRAF